MEEEAAEVELVEEMLTRETRKEELEKAVEDTKAIIQKLCGASFNEEGDALEKVLEKLETAASEVSKKAATLWSANDQPRGERLFRTLKLALSSQRDAAQCRTLWSWRAAVEADALRKDCQAMREWMTAEKQRLTVAGLGMVANSWLRGTLRGYVFRIRKAWEGQVASEDQANLRRLHEASQREKQRLVVAGLGMVANSWLRGTLRGYVFRIRKAWEGQVASEDQAIVRRLREASQRLENNTAAMRLVAIRGMRRTICAWKLSDAWKGIAVWRTAMKVEKDRKADNSIFSERLLHCLKLSFSSQEDTAQRHVLWSWQAAVEADTLYCKYQALHERLAAEKQRLVVAGLGRIACSWLRGSLRGCIFQIRRAWHEQVRQEEETIARQLSPSRTLTVTLTSLTTCYTVKNNVNLTNPNPNIDPVSICRILKTINP